jgi:class 3 adenylate cyclase
VATTEADKPERSPLVILFAEMRGFTGMSDMLDPGIVLARVGEFVSLMTKVVEKHEGAVVDILSDRTTPSTRSRRRRRSSPALRLLPRRGSVTSAFGRRCRWGCTAGTP